MASNKAGFKIKRQCKRCKTKDASVTVYKDGKTRENWYIDRTCPEGGWLCPKCYSDIKYGTNYAIIKTEFTVSSMDSLYKGVMKVKV